MSPTIYIGLPELELATTKGVEQALSSPVLYSRKPVFVSDCLLSRIGLDTGGPAIIRIPKLIPYTKLIGRILQLSSVGSGSLPIWPSAQPKVQQSKLNIVNHVGSMLELLH